MFYYHFHHQIHMQAWQSHQWVQLHQENNSPHATGNNYLVQREKTAVPHCMQQQDPTLCIRRLDFDKLSSHNRVLQLENQNLLLIQRKHILVLLFHVLRYSIWTKPTSFIQSQQSFLDHLQNPIKNSKSSYFVKMK